MNCILIVIGSFEYLDRMIECKFDTIKPCRGLKHSLNPLNSLVPPRNLLLICSLLKVDSSHVVQSQGNYDLQPTEPEFIQLSETNVLHLVRSESNKYL